jgi:hypothetical protein
VRQENVRREWKIGKSNNAPSVGCGGVCVVVEEEEGGRGRGRTIQEWCWSVSEQGNGGGLADVDVDADAWVERQTREVRVVKVFGSRGGLGKDFKERRDETSKDESTRAN